MNLNGQGNSPTPGGGPATYESILFFDEHIEDDSYHFELIDEFFVNPSRKPVKIAKEGIIKNNVITPVRCEDVGNFSRIDTDDDGNDSDSSIQQNLTYQALAKIKFPNNMKMGSRE